jgi:hypothetical protein
VFSVITNFVERSLMQTFLPLPDFEESLMCLDAQRLGKQRVEGKQILNAIKRGRGGWVSHPATVMWSNYVEALKLYTNTAIKLWRAMGYRNNMPLYEVGEVVMPYWWGDERVHSSHRAALLWKDYDFYSRYGWKEEPRLDYVWPSSKSS